MLLSTCSPWIRLCPLSYIDDGYMRYDIHRMQGWHVCTIIEGLVVEVHASSFDKVPRECSRELICILFALVVVKMFCDTDSCQSIASMVRIWTSAQKSVGLLSDDGAPTLMACP